MAYCGVDYENKMYTSREEWMNEKFNLGLPFPNLPYVIDGDAHITETKAIHQYIAKKFKPELLGKTQSDQGRIEMFLGPLH
jgi:glutathione S-transferase